MFESYAYVAVLLERKDLSLARLKRPLFGDTTETSQNVLGVDRPGVVTIIELGATAII